MDKNPTSTATKTRYCPRCVQRPLEACSYAGREVDVCPKCAGLWCEPADWDTKALGAFPAIGDAPQVPDSGVEDALTGVATVGTGYVPDGLVVEAQPHPTHACPSCGRLLTAIRIGGSETCELDQCEQCGGIWFDHGEWDHLGGLHTVQIHQQDLQRPMTWKEWSFQFLLALPIEFNVPARRLPVVTIVMITLCFLTFFAQLAIAGDQWQLFATYATRIWRGEALYALITSSFLHANLLHLLGNMYFLYILGDNVEDALGRWRYTLLYLGSAVASDLMHVVIFPESKVPLMGASGAVFGVMAAYLLLYPKARLTMMLIFWQFKVTFAVWMGLFLAIQVLGAIQTLPGQPGGIAYWGHLGGFLAGLLFVLPQRRALIQNHPLLRLLHCYPGPANAASTPAGKQNETPGQSLEDKD